MAANLIECLKDVVGLSKNPCPCLPDMPASESLSGLYIDDKSCGVPLGAIPKDCNDNLVWSTIIEAQTEGLRLFICDLQIGVKDVQKRIYKQFKGQIGSAFPTSTVTGLSNDIVGFWFKTCGIKGSTLTINCVGLAMDCDGLFDVELYASNQTEPILTIPIEAKQNKKVVVDLETPLNVPLFDSKGREIKYCLLYNRNGCNPKKTKFHCGCSGKAKPAYYNYLNVGGVLGNSVAELKECKPKDVNMYGLCMDIELDCGGIDWLCDVSENDWCNDPFFAVVAKTIQAYQIKYLAKSIGNKWDSFSIQCDIKRIFAKQSQMTKEIEWRMNWLRENIPEDRTDCFDCIGKSGVTKKELLV